MMEWLSANWVYMLIGVALAFLPYVRKASTYYSTLVHEIGHGVASLNPLSGLGGISIRPDTSGENMVRYSNSPLYIPIRILSLMSGYAAPIYVGVIFLIVNYFKLEGYFQWAILVVCGLSLLAIRNWFGALIILGHAAFWTAIIVLHILPLGPVLMVAGVILLSRGITDLVEVTKYSFLPQHKDLGTDFNILQNEFWLPRQVWYVLFVVLHTVIITIIATSVAGAVQAGMLNQ